MRVRELMRRPVTVVHRDTPLREVARLLLEQGSGAAAVVDDRGVLCGLITETDFAGRERCLPFSTERIPQVLGEWIPDEGIEALYALAGSKPTRAIMTERVVTATEDEPLTAAMTRMIHRDLSHLPVVRDGKPVGMLARRDALRLMTGSAATAPSAHR